MKKVLKTIDALSEWSGDLGRWLMIPLILAIVIEVTMRYAFNHPTMWAYESSIMLGAALYALAFSYAELHNAHVRVDVFYTRLSPRGKAIIDTIGGLVIFLPVMAMLVYTSWEWMLHAWKIKETMVLTYWYPPAYPLRTVIALGFGFLLLQGLAGLFRNFYLLIRNKSL
ncbi:MAG TPA: TRAP transporter small permease subunit [Dehalococcoidales bacterium]|nr:TRAP transporter small permease subunit [Dehalococcoidales bacterium]